MAGEWRNCTIGELCDAGVVELQTGPFGTQLHAYDYMDVGVSVVPTEAIRNRQIDHSVLPKVSAGKAMELERHRLEPGDILFARRGAQATGHIGYVRAAENGYLCGTGAIRLRVKARGFALSSGFLSHVLANPTSVEWFKFHAIGATMPNLNEGIIRSFPLHIPPFFEQVAIAEILGALDDRIELNRRMRETLEGMARALFTSWFGFVDIAAGDIPEGWQVKPIGEIATIVGGSTPRTDEPLFWLGGTHPWATPKDLADLRSPVLLGTHRQITDAGLQQIGSGLLPPGAVLLSSRAPIGYLAVAEVPVAINQGFIAMIPRPGVSNLFLLHWAREAQDAIVSRANGSTFLEISKSNFRPIPVITPPQSVMDAFDNVAQPLHRRVVMCERESATLGALRDTLLPKLMSGELRVPDAERIAVEAGA